MSTLCTGVILSGGKNKRFGNNNKAFAKIGHLRIIDHIYSLLGRIFSDVMIVTTNPSIYIDFDCQIVTDHYKIRSSINGIHAGLFASTTKYAFFIACDTPFAVENLISYIVNEIEPFKDIIIPKTSHGLEPLFAVYSKKCLKIIENQINQGNFKISKVFDKTRVKELNETQIKIRDPNLISFFNINTPDDLVEAENNFKCL